MTNRQRIRCVLNGQLPDRLPVVEWAGWWNLTVERWFREGLAPSSDPVVLHRSLGLDPLRQLWMPVRTSACPAPAEFGAPILQDRSEYESIRPFLYAESLIDEAVELVSAWRAGHEKGEYAMWLTLEGFFWFPRTLLGIEGHLYSFYDDPELIHIINQDLTNYHLCCLKQLLPVMQPDFMTFAEDMSYNNGPMISRELFEEFMVPYYAQIIPLLKQFGVKVLIDTDGFVEPLIPWFQDAGIEGVLPLERQAGVDVSRIQQEHPGWIMIGGYDKTIMHLGKQAMRAEFERLLPAMQKGYYIPSVDHQTPPDVSLAQYREYVALLQEYAARAVRG